MSKVIGIAGGSGSGKSTLAIELCKNYPSKFSLLHLDDYFKRTSETPKLGEFVNFEHPNAIRFDDLLNDLLRLLKGESIEVSTKSELYHPDYNRDLKNKITYTIEPKKIIILEGYLALHDSRIRALMSKKIYLDIFIEESTKRRGANKFELNDDYFEQVMIPMFKEYVEPQKNYADLIVDVSKKSRSEVYLIVENFINSKVE